MYRLNHLYNLRRAKDELFLNKPLMATYKESHWAELVLADNDYDRPFAEYHKVRGGKGKVDRWAKGGGQMGNWAIKGWAGGQKGVGSG